MNKFLVCSFLVLSGCSSILGTHPFSTLPKSSGKLDKTPRVNIIRGQAPEVCMVGEKTPLVYFIKLLWMEPQKVWIGVNGEPRSLSLFGTELTVNVKALGKPGYATYHELNIEVGEKLYNITTVVLDCQGFRGGLSGGYSDVSGS